MNNSNQQKPFNRFCSHSSFAPFPLLRYQEDRGRELGGPSPGGRGGGRGGGGRGGKYGHGGPRHVENFTSFANPLVHENGGTKTMTGVSKWLLPAMPMLYFN
jgi:hypothetical protein